MISDCPPSNATNNTVISTSYNTFLGLAYSLVFVIGLFVNGVALWAFIAKRAFWTDTHIYMLNLSLADFVLVIFLPFRIHDAFLRLPKTFLCTFLIFNHFMNMYASILTSTAISFHRYLIIRFPLQARSWKRRKLTAVAVCFIIWVALVSITVVFRKNNYPEKLWTCFERCKRQRVSLQLTLLQLILGFLAPLLVTLFCSNSIVCMLGKEQNISEERKGIIGIVKTNMIVFLVCYTPIHVAYLFGLFYTVPDNWTTTLTHSHVYLQLSELIASTNCCLDSISYYYLLKNILKRSLQ